MSLKVCPECGAEYTSTTTVCAEDGSELLVSDVGEMDAEIDEELAEAEDRDKADLDTGEVTDEPAGEQTAYELDDWSSQSRVLLDQLLNGEEVVHVWEAGTLVVRAEDEDRVDRLVDQVEVTSQPMLDEDKDQVSYELEGWPAAKHDALAESLGEAGIPFGFDEDGSLVIHEEDEDRVEPMLDQVDFNFSIDADDIVDSADSDGDDDEGHATSAGGDGDDDGLAAQAILSDLFVSADRLKHDAKDREGVLVMVRAAEQIADLGVPYGFAPGVWADLKARAAGLREILEATDAEDNSIKESAHELRDVLRQYV